MKEPCNSNKSNPKIYDTGHRGVVDSAIACTQQSQGYDNILARNRFALSTNDSRLCTHFDHTDQHLY